MDKTFPFSLYDLVSSVVPGIAFLLVVLMTQPKALMFPTEIIFLGLLSFGFIFGLGFLALGNLLYGVYIHPKNFREGSFKREFISVLHNLIKVVIRQDYALKGLDIRDDISKIWKKKIKQKELDSLSVFQLSDILVHRHGQTDRDDLLAKEGAFRSLSAMLLSLFFYLRILGNFGYPDWVWLLTLILSLRLMLYGHNYYQKIRQSQIYLFAYLSLKEINI